MGDGDINVNVSSSGTNFQTSTETEDTTIQSGVTLSDFKTVLVSLGYTDEQITNYLNNAAQPFLVTPEDTGVTIFDANKFLEDFFMSNPKPVGDTPGTETENKEFKTFGEEFQKKLSSLLEDPSFLTEMGTDNPDIAETKIKIALFFPDTFSSPEMQKWIASLKEGAPEGWPGKEATDAFQQEIGVKKDGSFEENLSMADEKEFTALRNAYYNNDVSGLSDSQKALLQEIMGAVGKDLEENYGIPSNLKVPSPGAEYFNTKLNLDLEDNFLSKLVELKLYGDLGLEGGISEKDFNVLRSMLSFKDLSNPDQARLNTLFQSLYDETLTEFKTDQGLPAGWTPTPQTAVGQAYADGMWRDQFYNNLNNLDIPLEQKNLILQGLADPASASPITQAMLAALVSQTTSEIISSLGLPASWKPVAKTVDPNVPIASLLMAKAGINNLKNIYNIGLKALQEMSPNDPNRTVLMDYLKRIGDALSKLQESMYIVESSSAKVAKVLSLAMQDMQKNKIEEARKQAEEAANQKDSKGYRKAHDTGKQTFMKIFTPIMAIVMVILALFTMNPVLLALAFFMLANSLSQVSGGPDMMKLVFEAIGEVTKTICEALGASPEITALVTLIVKVVLVVAICAAAIMLGGGMIASMILMTFIMNAVTSSGMIVDGIKVSNPNPTPEEIQKVTMIVMITMMAIMMTIMIGQMVASALGASAAASQAAASIGEQAAKIASSISTMMAQIMAPISQAIAALVAAFPMIGMAIQAIEVAVQVVIQALMKVVEIMKVAVDTVVNVTKAILDMMMNIMKTIVEKAKLLLDLLKTGLANFGQKVSQALDELAQKMLDVLDLSYDTLTMLQTAADFLGNTASTISQQITQLVQKLIDLVQNAKIVSDLQNYFKTAIENFKNLSAEEKLMRVANYIAAGGDMAQGVSSAVGGITQAQYNMLMAELIRMQAGAQAYIEETGALIKLLKKIIEALLDGMNPISQFIQEINTLQGKKYQDSSSGAGWSAIAS